MYDYAPVAAMKTPMENDERINWVTFTQELIQTLQDKDAIPVTELAAILKEKYSDIPIGYLKPATPGLGINLDNVLKVIRRGSPDKYRIEVVDEHPTTHEKAPNKASSWLVLTEGRNVPLSSMPLTPTPSPITPVPIPITPPTPKLEPILYSGEMEKLIPKSPKKYYPRKIEGMDDIDILKTAFNFKDERGQRRPANVLLSGPPGGGKTHSIETLAYQLKLPYKRVELYGGITAADLIGQYVPAGEKDIKDAKEKGLEPPRFVWMDGVLTQMVQKGGIFVADEINAMPRDLAMKLHGLLDHERRLVIPEAKDENGNPGKIIEAHPNFMFIAAMNPDVAGVHKLGPALKDRFNIILDYQYDPEVERKIVSNPALVIWAEIMRESYNNTIFSSRVSTRMLEQYEQNVKEFGKKRALAFLLNKFDEAERQVVEKSFSGLMDKGKGADEIRKMLMGGSD